MAIYSKKGKDPTEVALSAIQDALNIRDADVKPAPGPSPAAMPAALEAPNESRRRGSRAPTRELPLDAPPMMQGREMPGRDLPTRDLPTRDLPGREMPGRDDRDMVQAANDDQESIGQILQSLQRRSSPMPTVLATLFAAIWTVGLFAMIWNGQV